jgi:hypothetical protein
MDLTTRSSTMTKKTTKVHTEQYADLIEAKLSRSEVIDLVLEDMVADVEQKIIDLRIEIDALHKFNPPSSELFNLGLLWSIGNCYDLYQKDVQIDKVTLNFSSHKTSLAAIKDRAPTTYTTVMTIKEKTLKKHELEGMVCKLRSKGARNAMLKQLLSASPEGRELMEKLDLFRMKAKAALDAKLSTEKLLKE